MVKKQNSLGQLELDVLKILWSRKNETVAGVAEALSPQRGYARTTILTVIQRLQKKGFLKRSKVNGVYRYQPTREKKTVMANMVRQFVDSFFDGSGVSLVQHLTDSDVSDEELSQIRQVLDSVEARDKKGS